MTSEHYPSLPSIDRVLGKLFTDLNDEQLLILCAELTNVKVRHWRKGDIIYRHGQDVHEGVVLSSGLIRVFDHQYDHEMNLRFLSDASILVPFYSLTTSSLPYIARETAECLSDCHGYSFKLDWAASASQWAEFFKLEVAFCHYRSVEDRLRALHSTTATQRYHTFLATMPQRVIQEMPSFHIASYLGITPETLSRVRNLA